MKLIDSFEVEHFQPSTYIIRQNSPGDTFYIIADGKVDITADGNNFIRTLSKGDYFGEKALLEKHSHRTANVVSKPANKDENTDGVSCLCLQRDDFLRLIGPLAQKKYSYVGSEIDSSNNNSNRPSFSDSIHSPTVYELEDNRVSRMSGFGDFSFLSQTEISALSQGSEFLSGPRSSVDKDKKDKQVKISKPQSTTTTTTSTSTLRPNGSSKPNSRLNSEKIAYEEAEFGDLEYISTIGIGGFGRVELVRVLNDNKPLALKRIKKAHIRELKQEQHVVNERNILLQCRSPFIIKMYRTYRDRKYVYLLSEACLGGELWTLLRTKNYFNDNWARFYTGCALEALAYLHARGVVYRDLKPENLVLSPNGYAKLCDFGFAKKIGRHGDRTYTFCGTPEYVAPEIILNKGHDFTADLWALGIFIYELATGIPPFNYNDNMETYRAALRGVAQQGWGKNNSQQNSENRDLVSKGTKEIILALAREQPYERLGAGRGGFNDIRRHKWFRSFDFNGLIMRTLQPPFVPKLENQFDTSLFDPFGEDDEVPEDEMSGWDLDF